MLIASVLQSSNSRPCGTYACSCCNMGEFRSSFSKLILRSRCAAGSIEYSCTRVSPFADIRIRLWQLLATFCCARQTLLPAVQSVTSAGIFYLFINFNSFAARPENSALTPDIAVNIVSTARLVLSCKYSIVVNSLHKLLIKADS